MTRFMAILLLILLLKVSPVAAATTPVLPKLDPVDLGTLRRDTIDFTPLELERNVLRYYLGLEEAVNRMADSGEYLGWTRIPSRNDEPYNARNQELLLLYSYFFTADRPWNQYYMDEALLKRIEAGLLYWTSLQTELGGFCQWSPTAGQYEQWCVAALNMERILLGYKLLKEAGIELAPEVEVAFYDTCKRAVDFLLAHPTNNRSCANQMAGGMVAVAMFIDVFGETHLRDQLDEMIGAFFEVAQSPAGYYYEAMGPCLAYGFHVTDGSLRTLYLMTKDPRILEGHRAFYRFMSYNMLWEPAGNGFINNRSLSSRQEFPTYTPGLRAWYDEIPLAAAFGKPATALPSPTELQNLLRFATPRQVFGPTGIWRPLTINWGSPGDILALLTHGEYALTPEMVAEQRQELPYLKSDRFTVFLHDPQENAEFLYVRRPDYYFSFAGGRRRENQRMGPASLWHPQLGTILWSSRIDQPNMAWSTWSDVFGVERALEEFDIITEYFTVSGEKVANPEATSDFHGFTYYVPGAAVSAVKTVRFAEREVTFQVTARGSLRETVPLLVAEGDDVVLEGIPGAYELRYLRGGEVVFRIQFDGALECSLRDTGDSYLGKRLKVVTLWAQDELNYTVQFD